MYNCLTMRKSIEGSTHALSKGNDTEFDVSSGGLLSGGNLLIPDEGPSFETSNSVYRLSSDSFLRLVFFLSIIKLLSMHAHGYGLKFVQQRFLFYQRISNLKLWKVSPSTYTFSNRRCEQ